MYDLYILGTICIVYAMFLFERVNMYSHGVIECIAKEVKKQTTENTQSTTANAGGRGRSTGEILYMWGRGIVEKARRGCPEG